jgi:predicted O-methyltransferase YrrM
MKPAREDKFLLEEILKLKKHHRCTTFIETGTWIGLNADIVSKHFDKVISFEVNQEFYQKALENNINNQNVELIFGNSGEVLKNYINCEENTIFFLDAHWGEYWPLLDELETIAALQIQPVIIIHDFYVPDMNGNAKFDYDKYGQQPLDLEYVKEKIQKIFPDGYTHYCTQQSEINSGSGIFMSKR